MKKYTTKNETVLSIIDEFNCFHQYLFIHDFFNNSYKSVFDLSVQNEQEKLNLYADCQSQLSTLSEYFLYTNENFKKSHLYDLQKKYRSILELMILIKPDVKESDLESLLSLEYQYIRIFESASRNIAQQITNNNDNKEFNKKLQLLNQEYESKANFYTAANEIKQKKHYTEETWFIVGLKFADGAIYENENNAKDQSDLARIVFGDTKHQPYINQTLSNTNTQKNIYQRTKAKQELKKIYQYCIENDIKMHKKFEDQYLIVQSENKKK